MGRVFRVPVRGLWWVCLPLVMCLLSACGGGGPGDGAGVGPDSVRAAELVYTPFPTATAWPTFTPYPTPSPTDVPVPVPSPTPTSVPVVVPALAPIAPVDVVDVAAATPAPTPYGKYPGKEVYFRRQFLFPLLKDDVPDYVWGGLVEQWPPSFKVVKEYTPYVVWAVAYDLGGVGAGEVVKGVVRWWDVTPGWEPLLIMEQKVNLSEHEDIFYVGLGEDPDRPGSRAVWSKGRYRLEFLSDELESVVDWFFEVR